MKKVIIPALLTISVLGTNTAAWAQAPANPFAGMIAAINNLPASITAGITGGFTQLETFLNTGYTNASTWVYDQTYPTDAATAAIFQKYVNVNTVKKSFGQETFSPTHMAAEVAKQKTQNNLNDTLMQFPYMMYANQTGVTTNTTLSSLVAADGQKFKDYMMQNSLASLTVDANADAGDTLYVGDEKDKAKTYYLNHKKMLEKPKTYDNSFLNFSTLITPVTYTPTESAAADKFIVYAARSTQDLTEGTDLNKLSQDPEALDHLKHSKAYSKYVLSIRTLLAIRSITLNTLNTLTAERKPVAGLAAAIGLPKNPNPKAGPRVSALQVEEYQANHQLENPNFYSRLQKESPATIQRETLVALLVIQHQNYQAHLDRERLMTETAAANLSTNSAMMGTALIMENEKLKKAVKKALEKPAPKVKESKNLPAKEKQDNDPTKSINSSKSSVVGPTGF
ncbi:MAG: hypothetical protein NTU49_11285 [Gammaproteobacteria bacterium]|nr:hypothetical protein [Gammaproteobacteria bacterium]